MLPFEIPRKSGMPIHEQIVWAVKKAVFSGKIREGDKFPSVRQLSEELLINPNTAHRAVVKLTEEGFLNISPGVGATVTLPDARLPRERESLLEPSLQNLIIQAKSLRCSLEEVRGLIGRRWDKLEK